VESLVEVTVDIFRSETKVFFLDGPGTLVTFVENLGVIFSQFMMPFPPGIPKLDGLFAQMFTSHHVSAWLGHAPRRPSFCLQLIRM
jgi:tRNA(His) 5'-end guanylyltransferase